MTIKIRRLNSSVEEHIGEVVENRVIRLLPTDCIRGKVYAAIEAFSPGTSRSPLVDQASTSPQASGQCPFLVLRPENHDPNPAPMSISVRAGSFTWSGVALPSSATLMYEVGRVYFASGITLPPGQVELFDDVYLRSLRNSLAHSFYSPIDEERDAKRIKATAFLSSLYRRIGQQSERIVMRMIYSYLYQLRMSEDYGVTDRILEDVDVNRLAPALLTAVLTITAPLSKKLRQRDGFFKRAKQSISRVLSADEAEQILVGLH